jgi:hypothetical protein
LVLALYVHYSTPDEKVSTVTKPLHTPTITPTPSKMIANQKSLDLVGPYHCSYAQGELKTEVFIKNRQVFSSMQDKKTSYFMLKGDCIYNWEITSTKGSKVCGMSQYLSMYEMMASMNLVKIQDIIDPLLKNSHQGESGQLDFLIPELTNNCKKEEVNDALFTLPTTVQFISPVTPTK